MDSILSVQNKPFSGDGKEFQKVCRAVRKAESHLHWQFIGNWQILWRSVMESSNVYTSSIRDERYCWKSGTQSKRRNVCCTVAIGLGRLNGGLILWNATAICEVSKTSWQMRNLFEAIRRTIRRLQKSIWSNSWKLSDLCTRPVKASPIWKESFAGHTPRICIDRGGIFWKEIFWLQTLRNWKRWTYRKSTLEESMQKKYWQHKGMNILYSQSQMEQQSCQEETKFREPTSWFLETFLIKKTFFSRLGGRYSLRGLFFFFFFFFDCFCSTRKPKVIYTDNSLEFGKSCEELSWNYFMSKPQRSETNGIAERAVRRVKEGTSAVPLQSGLDEKWWADLVECYCYLRNVQDLLSDGKNTLRTAIRRTI